HARTQKCATTSNHKTKLTTTSSTPSTWTRPPRTPTRRRRSSSPRPTSCRSWLSRTTTSPVTTWSTSRTTRTPATEPPTTSVSGTSPTDSVAMSSPDRDALPARAGPRASMQDHTHARLHGATDPRRDTRTDPRHHSHVRDDRRIRRPPLRSEDGDPAPFTRSHPTGRGNPLPRPTDAGALLALDHRDRRQR